MKINVYQWSRMNLSQDKAKLKIFYSIKIIN